ncbi:bifunctional phosphopantothenoylcysteine decarboxylase/phosphopantothenate--cysteine ligase CoaBC [Haloglycomyces albus]|uniref:bifunctional phosphopantothenoylcysteine decarboxylase/phosphopantothenate--cysteine ligase CoaBC n=1 Tax=Haloglycomyces albus TaxID=526067 RepID=UPI00046C91E9|nr:bifunctional phosphopantothenoylcysteine decarboxylase/phosphopantothenate--cysteine ligase CoaBC [Haloglycomyces albus]
MRIVLGISGGIAAYKSALVLRALTESGHDVVPIPTESALKFVGKATWEALSGHEVTSEVFESVSEVRHVALGRSADLVAVVPATADLLARAATGRSDDLLTSTLLTATSPVVFAPAMHTEMWEHPATQANIATLRGRGNVVIEPSVGRLTGADSGAGRLPEPAEITGFLRAFTFGELPDLRGRRIVVSAGGTREALDPVRFIGNRSSGHQGMAIAAAAAAAGAQVDLLCGQVERSVPAGVNVTWVETTEDLAKATETASQGADAVILAAAPADYRPARYSAQKMKRTGESLSLELAPNSDIAAGIGRKKDDGQVMVIFAAETDDGHRHAAEKLHRKNADVVVLNDVSDGRVFGAATNSVTILDSNGTVASFGDVAKEQVAHELLRVVAERLTGLPPG